MLGDEGQIGPAAHVVVVECRRIVLGECGEVDASYGGYIRSCRETE